MNQTDFPTVAPTAFPADVLSQLELSIAQRADLLAQADGCERGRDLEHWLQAEHEIFANCEKARGQVTCDQ